MQLAFSFEELPPPLKAEIEFKPDGTIVGTWSRVVSIESSSVWVTREEFYEVGKIHGIAANKLGRAYNGLLKLLSWHETWQGQAAVNHDKIRLDALLWAGRDEIASGVYQQMRNVGPACGLTLQIIAQYLELRYST